MGVRTRLRRTERGCSNGDYFVAVLLTALKWWAYGMRLPLPLGCAGLQCAVSARNGCVSVPFRTV